MKVRVNDQVREFDAVVILMDSEIREELNTLIGGCPAQEFVDEYAVTHYTRFGEIFRAD